MRDGVVALLTRAYSWMGECDGAGRMKVSKHGCLEFTVIELDAFMMLSAYSEIMLLVFSISTKALCRSG